MKRLTGVLLGKGNVFPNDYLYIKMIFQVGQMSMYPGIEKAMDACRYRKTEFAGLAVNLYGLAKTDPEPRVRPNMHLPWM
ncbi:MAG: hypothetical protein WB502_16145 [Thermoactinomyces sp.]